MNSEIKQAVIVAAGKSSRLYPLTEKLPKSLLELGGKPIIKRAIDSLKSIGVEKIYVVVGFCRESFQDYIGDTSITFIQNPFFEKCNNLGSLWFAKNFISEEPFIYLHADVAFEHGLLENFIQISKNNDSLIDLAVDFDHFDEESMKVLVNDKNDLIESNKQIALSEASGEWTGLAVIKKPNIVFQQMEQDLYDEDLNHYDTFSFSKLAKDRVVSCIPIHGAKWLEIDFLNDYEKAQELFK